MAYFGDIYQRIARLVMMAVIIVMMGVLYFFFYPPRNPDAALYFIRPYIEKVAVNLHLLLQSTAISDVTYTSRDAIVKKILIAHPIALHEPLPFIPAGLIKKQLETLPMIESAIVVVHYPSRQLRVNFTERQPLAFLPRHNQIITRDGLLLARPPIGDLPSNIIRLRGKGDEVVAERFIALFNILQSYSLLLDIVREVEFVGGRRWRLWLARPLIRKTLLVEMPENMDNNDIQRLSRLVLEEKILDLKIEKLDLRLANQTVVRLLSPEK
ncbi:MAG: cell division protein FtsQ/DivIB [Alphaproteobacteria bacterium]